MKVGTFGRTMISFLDLILLVVSVVLLGWVGVAVFLATNVIAFLAVSLRLAMKQEETLLYAATQCDASKEDFGASRRVLYSH